MKTRWLWIPLIALMLVSFAMGQPAVEWEIAFGDSVSNSLQRIVETQNGELLVVYRASGEGALDNLARFDGDGTVLWERPIRDQRGCPLLCAGETGTLYTASTWQNYPVAHHPKITAFSSGGDSLWTVDYVYTSLAPLYWEPRSAGLFGLQNGNLVWIGLYNFSGSITGSDYFFREFSAAGDSVSTIEIEDSYMIPPDGGYTPVSIRRNDHGETLVLFNYEEWDWTHPSGDYWWYRFRIDVYDAGYNRLHERWMVDRSYAYRGARSFCETDSGYYCLWQDDREHHLSYFRDFDSEIETIEIDDGSPLSIEPHESGGIVMLLSGADGEGLHLRGYSASLLQRWDTIAETMPLYGSRSLLYLGGSEYCVAGQTHYPSDSVTAVYLAKLNIALPVDDEPSIGTPAKFALNQNYPNPFNPVTGIEYNIATTGDVSLTVYDVLGREVATLAQEIQSAGNYTVQFDGADLPSGVYIYRLQAGEFMQSRKMVLLK